MATSPPAGPPSGVIPDKLPPPAVVNPGVAPVEIVPEKVADVLAKRIQFHTDEAARLQKQLDGLTPADKNMTTDEARGQVEALARKFGI